MDTASVHDVSLPCAKPVDFLPSANFKPSPRRTMKEFSASHYDQSDFVCVCVLLFQVEYMNIFHTCVLKPLFNYFVPVSQI